MPRSVVTGVAGFIGSHPAEHLALGHEVVGIDCFTPYYSRRRKRARLATGAAHRVAHEFDLATNAAMLKELLVEVAT